MRTAIMQPYLFPYIGYFQLLAAVDVFVVYDDVNFIKKGWINRNNILVNGKAFLFSIPLVDASQNKPINTIDIAATHWQSDILKTIALSYKKAPYFETVFPLITEILEQNERNLARFITFSLRSICAYLTIETKIVLSSVIEKDSQLKAQDKIIEICKKLDTKQYVNAAGGKELYDHESFEREGMSLHFIQSKPIIYSQFKNEFIPWLSIIDVMMFNSVAEIRTMLQQTEWI